MRVLFVNRMASLVRGGGETFDLEISAELQRLGCEVSYMTGAPQWGRPVLPLGRSRAHLVHSPYLPWFPWDKVKGGWRVRVWEFQQFENKAAAWIQLHANEFDIIQICELPYLVSLLKSKLRGPAPKIVMRLTAPNAFDPWGGIGKADGLIASGTSIEIIRRTVRPDVHDIPNAVDSSRFRESDIAGSTNNDFRCIHGIADDAVVLLYVARFQAFKNHGLLLRAFALIADRLPNVCLVLAGSGPLQRDARQQVRSLGLTDRVVFLDEVAYEELPRVYAAADIKVISSDYESFCFAAVEAMATGLPVVTTDCGWVPRLLGDSLPPIEKQGVDSDDPPERFGGADPGHRIREAPGGLIVGRNDPASLAAAVLRLTGDAGQAKRFGKWNREKAVREHGWESSAQKLLKMYEDIVS